MPVPIPEKLVFGVNPYDLCPNTRARYHVIDDKGFIRCKCEYGFAAFDYAGNVSDREANVTFTVIDTADGSTYGLWRNGEDLELPGEEN